MNRMIFTIMVRIYLISEVDRMSKLYVYMFRSRNKDNKDIQNFKERCKTILEYEENEEKVYAAFRDFANKGLLGEKTRLYKSVNERDEDKVREEVIIRLIRDKTPLPNINRLLASAAQQICNRAESKWLFDFDSKDVIDLDCFILDMVKCYGEDNYYEITETPNGFAIVVDHGFDTRELMEEWKDYDITLKKDELLFLDMIENQ